MTVSFLYFLASFSLIIFACTLKMVWAAIGVIALIAATLLKSVWHLSAGAKGSLDGLFSMQGKEKPDPKKHGIDDIK